MSATGKCPNCEHPYQGDPVTCADCGEVLSTLPIIQAAVDSTRPPLTPTQRADLHAALADTRKACAESLGGDTCPRCGATALESFDCALSDCRFGVHERGLKAPTGEQENG